MSNLTAARTLVQADLDHARKVLELWNHQVAELEKALTQLDTVGKSRNALRVEYQESRGRAPLLEAPAAIDAPKRGRKPKSVNPSAATFTGPSKGDSVGEQGDKPPAKAIAKANRVSVPKSGKPRKNAAASKRAGPAMAKYKDPSSEKTWVGRGRRPDWLTGSPEQYLIRPLGQSKVTNANDAANGVEGH